MGSWDINSSFLIDRVVVTIFLFIWIEIETQDYNSFLSHEIM